MTDSSIMTIFRAFSLLFRFSKQFSSSLRATLLDSNNFQELIKDSYLTIPSIKFSLEKKEPLHFLNKVEPDNLPQSNQSDMIPANQIYDIPSLKLQSPLHEPNLTTGLLSTQLPNIELARSEIYLSPTPTRSRQK